MLFIVEDLAIDLASSVVVTGQNVQLQECVAALLGPAI